MSKILLDYVFPITQIVPTPAASTAFLKQACLVCKPKSGQEANVGEVFECTTMTQVAARTDNSNAQQLFNAGMNRVFILLSDSLDLATALAENESVFFTLLISDDFDDDDIETGIVTAGVKSSKKIQDILFTAVVAGAAGDLISIEYVDDGTAGAETVDVTVNAIVVHMEAGTSTAQNILDAIEGEEDAAALVTGVIDTDDEDRTQIIQTETNLVDGVDEVTGGDGLQVGTFPGVVGVSTEDSDFAQAQAAIENRAVFFASSANKAKNLCYGFGKLLSNLVNWLNQQFITMPFNDDVTELGAAESLFDDKTSFVIHDDEFGNRLALFAVGGHAIVAPYILKNLKIDLQSRSLNWISGNQPQYTKKEAALLETRLQEDVINQYINVRKWITAGVIEITLVNDNFVATGAINVSEPKALWRVFSEMRQTL